MIARRFGVIAALLIATSISGHAWAQADEPEGEEADDGAGAADEKAPKPFAHEPDEEDEAQGGGKTKPLPIQVRATPLFGPDASTGDGWIDVVITVENISGAPFAGEVELASSLPWGGDQRFASKGTFRVAASRTVTLTLPTHGFPYQTPNYEVVVRDESGDKLTSIEVTASTSRAPLLVDVHQPSRLSVAMKGWPVSTTWDPLGGYRPTTPSGAGTTGPNLTMGTPTLDRATGDPILPTRVAGYAPVTAILMHTDTFVQIEPVRLRALSDWVLGGGTLALIPKRPEDFRHERIVALVGGEVKENTVPEFLFSLPGVKKPEADPSPFGIPDEDDEDVDTSPIRFEDNGRTGSRALEHGASPYRFARASRLGSAARLGPGPEVAGKLRGFQGGNLTPSVFGATAAYGLGEVHMLAFDPSVAPMVDDPWVHGRIVQLVERAWDHRGTVALQPGVGERNMERVDEMRRALDPNENYRPALGLSALLLVAYSIIVGPVLFSMMTRRKKPLSALAWAPVISFATFSAIVVIGLAAKGWRGRARRIAIVETAAGMDRGNVRRYRGFFTSRSSSLAVSSTDGTTVLGLASDDFDRKSQGSLRVERDQASLEELTAVPWQTVVVREDGADALGGTIAILPSKVGGFDVTNHLGVPLKQVVVYDPDDGLRFFDQIADGATIKSADGRLLAAATTRRTSSAGAAVIHPLWASDIASQIGGIEGEAFSRVWEPVEAAAGESADWWPDTLPVVLGTRDAPPAAKYDGPLPLETEDVLVRVVGVGGKK